MKKLAKLLEAGPAPDSDYHLNTDLPGWVQAENAIDLAVKDLAKVIVKNKKYLGDNSKEAITHAVGVVIDI